MQYADHLREEAGKIREQVAEMVKRLQSRPSILNERLTHLATAEGVPENVKTEMLALAEEFGRDTAIPIVTAAAGAATANIYEALADQAEYLMARGAMKIASERLRRNREFNQSLRAAAAAGDWESFDGLVESYIKGPAENQGNGSGS